jgi:hypothetical protein
MSNFKRPLSSISGNNVNIRNINEKTSAGTNAIYNGGYRSDEDPADYVRSKPIKAVRLG